MGPLCRRKIRDSHNRNLNLFTSTMLAAVVRPVLGAPPEYMAPDYQSNCSEDISNLYNTA